MEMQYVHYLCKGYIHEFQAVRVGFVVDKEALVRDFSFPISIIPPMLYTP
jgi:hypothetical protein